MTKIQTIKITNFKAIDDLEADFNGCTAIITGGNNKGKTSFLRGIPDRIRFVRPDVMVKKGATDGKGELTLTSGERFVWDFGTDGRDKLTYITSEGARRSVTKDLGAQFFPPTFDIDKFLQSSPKEQAKQLQAIIGLDFTEIDRRYQKAYDLRTERNREAELYRVKLEKLIKSPKVDKVDLTDLISKKDAEKKRLNDLYLDNRKNNDKTRSDYNDVKAKIDKEVAEFNEEQFKKELTRNNCETCVQTLEEAGYKGDARTFVESLTADLLPPKKAIELYPKEPTYIDEMPDRSELDKIDAQILSANETNAAAMKYQEYIDHKNATESARSSADEADQVVKAIEKERLDLIASKKMPEGIEITTDGILVDGLPLDRNQISTSKLYTSALKIASINLGEVRTLYFDASFLDKITLAEIQKWANENDLQLLIERPDYDGGDIKYELIEQ